MEVTIKTAPLPIVLFFSFLVSLLLVYPANVAAQSECVAAQPEMSLGMNSVYWSSYSDYVNRTLSVDFQFGSASAKALEVTVRDAANTNNALLSTGLPYVVGDIGAGGNASATLRYSIPAETWQFRSVLFVSARDECGYRYFYPSAYHITKRLIDNPVTGQAIDELYLYGMTNGKIYFGIGQTPGWGTGTGYVAKYDMATGQISVIASLRGFTCWQAINQVIDNKIFIFGQGRGNDSHSFALAGYVDLTNDSFVWHEVPNTGDANEFLGAVYDPAYNRFIVGERSAGGDPTGSFWPGGRGLWTIPLATFDNPATYQRVWQDPGTYSSIRTLDIFDGKLYLFASIDSQYRIHIKSAPLDNLTDWTDELVGKTGDNKNFDAIWVDHVRNTIYLEKNTFNTFESEMLQRTPGGVWMTTVFNTRVFKFAGQLDDGRLLVEYDTIDSDCSDDNSHDLAIVDPVAGTFTQMNLAFPDSDGIGITRFAVMNDLDRKLYWSFTNGQNPPAEIWECDGY